MQTEIQRAVEILRAGGLVAFPTETVYGLGADATNPDAVRRIFAAKGRPADHPLIVHLASAEALTSWALEVPHTARKLAERFWPGPLTLIVKRAPSVIDEVTGGQDTVGVRVPSHPMAQALLHAFGGGIAAPSANRFGRISPTTAQHVREELGDHVDLVLDGGPCEVGIESTIVDVSSGAPTLLRPGRIGAEEIGALLGTAIRVGAVGAPRASGMLAAHYAPGRPLLLIPAEGFDGVVRRHAATSSVAVLAHHPRPASALVGLWKLAPVDPVSYAHDLYAALRELDKSGCDRILVEIPPRGSAWIGVHDRLRRAAAGSAVESEGGT